MADPAYRSSGPVMDRIFLFDRQAKKHVSPTEITFIEFFPCDGTVAFNTDKGRLLMCENDLGDGSDDKLLCPDDPFVREMMVVAVSLMSHKYFYERVHTSKNYIRYDALKRKRIRPRVTS
ncbi:MAG: hypothetical protein UY72_C0064G0007 [Candidatus Uhrbacteria bacterium GW2011_GWD2_52_7]|uniref:Uncharacterized protein n=1 Tax=Candidatus Uhrbacteria bacterium GW2011_GWD2_52_7 TaxID=1618989 RepID=A0A0G2A8N5_9BACT|nr:MAG: hypothetical protein UY72_C0064G0007 [Candidatus Uhrbacteria bacterium GW2011_GWD2_52_7]